MGFRSLLLTEDTDLEVPAWFLEKHPGLIALRVYDGKPSLPIVSKWETKFYDRFDQDERFLDLQRILVENGDSNGKIEVVLFHECGGISKVIVTATSIQGMEPEPLEWYPTDEVTHSYCNGCSEPQ